MPTSSTQMKANIFILLVLVVNSIFFLPSLMDLYQVSRFTSLSITLLLGGLLFYPTFRKLRSAHLLWLDVLILGLYGIHLLSVVWALNFGEAMFTAQRFLLLFVVYYFTRMLLSLKKAQALPTLYWGNFALTVIVLIATTYRMSEVIGEGGYNSASLYKVRILMGNKTLLTEFIFYLLPLNLVGALRSGKKYLFAGIVLIQLAFIVLMLTRSVWLVTLLTGMIFAFYGFSSPGFRKSFFRFALPSGAILITVIIGILAFTGSLGDFWQRVDPSKWMQSDTAVERSFMWEKTWLIIRESGLTGIGSGSWKVYFPGFGIEGIWRFEQLNVFATRAHNDYLEVWAETGILGFLCFVGLFGLALNRGYRKLSRLNKQDSLSLLFVLSGIFAFAFISIFDFPKERIETQTMLGIFLALTAYWCKSDFQLTKRKNPPGNWYPVFYGFLTFALAANIFIGFQRIEGEAHVKKAIQAKGIQDWPTTISEAQKAYSIWYDLDPTVVPVKWYEGVGHFRENRIEEALETFYEAYAVNPYNFHVLNNLATALSQLKRYEEAVPYFEEALRINPKFDDCKFNLAYTLYFLGRYEEARKWAETTSDWDKKKLFLDTIDAQLK